MKQYLKYAIRVFAISTLFFFAISFLSILNNIGSQWHDLPTDLRIEIGFPFQFYYQFTLGPEKTFGGWNGNNFIYDYFITMIAVVGAIAVNDKLFSTKKVSE